MARGPRGFIVSFLIGSQSFFFYFFFKQMHYRYGKKVPADLVFAMLLLRLGNPVPITGLMAAMWGYSRTYISAWTTWMLHWLWDTWGHLMTFNKAYVERNAKKWSYKIGLRMGIPTPINCRYILRRVLYMRIET